MPSGVCYYEPRGSMLEVWKATDLEILHDGPAGTGKTRGLCELTHYACALFPGCRIGWVMKTRANLTDTVLNTYEQLVVPGCEVLEGPAAQQRTQYVYSNGSRIVLRGLDDPNKTRSLELDWVIVFEGTLLAKNDYEMLLRCLRWNRIPRKRIIVDTNPSGPDHWLLERVNSGKMRRIPSTHKDNPVFWDEKKGDYTPEGREYITKRLEGMTGAMRQRLLNGLWVAEEGAVFDADRIMRHKERHGQAPWTTGDLIPTVGPSRPQDQAEGMGDAETPPLGHELDRMIRAGRPNAVRFIENRVNPQWSFWCELENTTDGYRPPQDTNYVLAADVSWGMNSSNSVIGAWDSEKRRKVAEFACAHITPERFARLLAAAGYWFGGKKGMAFIIFEVNGPGENMPKFLRKVLSYPWLYSQGDATKGYEDKTQLLGWRSNRERKIRAAMDLRDAYDQDSIINPSIRALDETLGWVRYTSGGIGPARLEAESLDARATHGDRTIADIMAVIGLAEAPLMKVEVAKPRPIGRAVVGSFVVPGGSEWAR